MSRAVLCRAITVAAFGSGEDRGWVARHGTRWHRYRAARWRDTAGMTQQQLADRVGKTRAYISLIENGRSRSPNGRY